MVHRPSLWQSIRWPLLVLLIGLVGLAAATILDVVFGSEWSLTIGAPSLWFLLPIGGAWLILAVVLHHMRNRRPS
jgi:hypothetical protein